LGTNSDDRCRAVEWLTQNRVIALCERGVILSPQAKNLVFGERIVPENRDPSFLRMTRGVTAALDLDQTARRLGRDAAEAPVADDVLLLDDVIAGGAEVGRLDAKHYAIVEGSGIIRVK
jgi:hypothetical protein